MSRLAEQAGEYLRLRRSLGHELAGVGPVTSAWARRMTVARGFARYMSGIDPATQVPPLGLVTFRCRWRPPLGFR